MYQWLSLCIEKLGISLSDFWDMPFFVMVELLRMRTTNNNTLNRKSTLDQMRYNSHKRGWVC